MALNLQPIVTCLNLLTYGLILVVIIRNLLTIIRRDKHKVAIIAFIDCKAFLIIFLFEVLRGVVSADDALDVCSSGSVHAHRLIWAKLKIKEGKFKDEAAKTPTYKKRACTIQARFVMKSP